MKLPTLLLLLFCRVFLSLKQVSAWVHPSWTAARPSLQLCLDSRPSGSFFNQVPSDDDDNNDENMPNDKVEESLEAIIRERTRPSRATEPSTINGVPSHKAGIGFGKTNEKNQPVASIQRDSSSKPYVGIGPVLNDVTKPEYDDQGYTLYADEETGKRSRVFEALVDYPCLFTIKIVGATEGGFLQDMLSIVATTCGKETDAIQHSVKRNGKWTSITVEAPVDSAEMLYQLYENIDRDPRVRFKF